jgi:error-prone DNA polymerase
MENIIFMATMLEKYGWFEWSCHTNYSFLKGASHPGEYVARAIANGYQGIGITDYDGVYGVVSAYRALKKEVDPRVFRLFYGAEIHFSADHSQPILLQDTLILIAKTHQGYANLCRVLTRAHRRGKHQAHLVFEEFLQEDLKGLVAIHPMRGLVRQPSGIVALEDRLKDLREIFSDDLYLQISRHFHPAEDRWISPYLLLAKRYNISCLLGNDPYFHDPSRKRLHDVLQSIATNQTLDCNVDYTFPNDARHLPRLNEIEKIYRSLSIYESALIASRDLAERCSFELSEIKYCYPQEMIPKGYSSQQYLEESVWENYHRIYIDGAEKVKNLLRHELILVNKLGFADYFLTVWDIVSWARRQGILCQGRGSAANSAICYVLGITSVDPAQFDLLFERFISAERGDPPDIDVDFEHERREEVIQYIYQRYGRNRAAMVANVITFRTRGAIRAVGKALGFNEESLHEAAEVLKQRHTTGKNWDAVQMHLANLSTSDQSGSNNTSPQESSKDIADVIPLWIELAKELKGFPRHLGIHSGGFVATHQHLDFLCPQEPATMEGRTVIQWSKDDIEELHIFKIDVLALGMLTAISKCLKSLKACYGKEFKITDIPPEDPKTYDMISRANTIGTFQIESRAQMSMLPRLRPRTFYDLVIQVAIIRPGPIQGGLIHPFLRRRNGQEAITFPDQRLVSILKRTLGVPIFQEQVMRIAMAVGNFTGGQANELRRNMGAWQMKGNLNPLMEQLAVGMRENGISEEFTQAIIDQMRAFADYGFPESHAASFAHIAYVSAYLKCYFPAQFFTALLNSQPMGFYSSHTLIQTAKREGVVILPVSVLHSEWDMTLERSDQSINGFALRMGFRCLRSLNFSAVERLVKFRKLAEERGSRWENVTQFMSDARLFRHELTILASAGAWQCLGIERRQAIWLASSAPVAEHLDSPEDTPRFSNETEWEAVQYDFQSTGTSLGEHASLLIKKHYWDYPLKQQALSLAKDLVHVKDGVLVNVFGMTIVRQAPQTAKGMVFYTLEDETGLVNLVFRPNTYQKYYQTLENFGFICCQGRLQKDQGAISILVLSVYVPQPHKGSMIPLKKSQTQKAEPACDILPRTARNFY